MYNTAELPCFILFSIFEIEPWSDSRLYFPPFYVSHCNRAKNKKNVPNFVNCIYNPGIRSQV